MKWIFIIILLAITVIFTIQNYEIVKIQFLFWSIQTSRALMIFLTLLIGIVMGAIICITSKKKE